MFLLTLLVRILAEWSQLHFRPGMRAYPLPHAGPAGNRQRWAAWVENRESIWPILVRVASGSAELQGQALCDQPQLAVAGSGHSTGSRPTAEGCQLAPLPAPPHLLVEGDTGRGWEALASFQPEDQRTHILLGEEGRRLWRKGTLLSPGKGARRGSLPIPFPHQLHWNSTFWASYMSEPEFLYLYERRRRSQ